MELSSAKEIYVGGKKAAEIYIGGKLVWPLYKESDTWEDMEWNGQTNIYARYVWTDGKRYIIVRVLRRIGNWMWLHTRG